MTVQPFSPDSDLTLDEAMDELVSAEDFLEFFGVPFDQPVVHVNRLHIMQRYHDYLTKAGDLDAHDDQARYAVYRQLLARAYLDFVESDALTEKVFKVFRMHEPQKTFVSIDQLLS
ncbi:nitrogenase-stabilizing/protective protein [Azotobacter beijerinckii]|uniref:Nitrogenase-stabilizing/protective protein NifW n=1 Tax=Azotobacter beijerinckii TaxID=170623 RepID=A0A1I4BPY4_9GAMM|nr:nitrogenase-stabilizing/protective protein NifW [Azotobacter beijerinckii]MDV7211374.1 nitrogenase-stabilizing/protective protein NifW [Azotobacter beijerinckii]SEI87961.1 nitrogenase-stabilizing/protective protein [Azotobacter beijerinckii]SEI93644.1 nitrogenase-stabilizing/protective protein [Azotobacter beijerinckii]SEP76207.1 nitrogenase-stabilizing/protective protein [Azotobacter beijerinckii]SFB08943.1 nitrogenase-stabilizing/protective protein [Azotobacter beijerinckii]